jgi:hypothetical protein
MYVDPNPIQKILPQQLRLALVLELHGQPSELALKPNPGTSGAEVLVEGEEDRPAHALVVGKVERSRAFEESQRLFLEVFLLQRMVYN